MGLVLQERSCAAYIKEASKRVTNKVYKMFTFVMTLTLEKAKG